MIINNWLENNNAKLEKKWKLFVTEQRLERFKQL